MSTSIDKPSLILQKPANNSKLSLNESFYQQQPCVYSQIRNSQLLDQNNLKKKMELRGQAQRIKPMQYQNQNQQNQFSQIENPSQNFKVLPANNLIFDQNHQSKFKKINPNNFKNQHRFNTKPESELIDSITTKSISQQEYMQDINIINQDLVEEQLKNQGNIKRNLINQSQQQNQIPQIKCKNKINQKRKKVVLKKQKIGEEQEQEDINEETVSDFEEEYILKRAKRKRNKNSINKENQLLSNQPIQNSSSSNIMTRHKSQLLLCNLNKSQSDNKSDEEKQNNTKEVSPEQSTIQSQKKIKNSENDFQDEKQTILNQKSSQLSQIKKDLSSDKLVPKAQKLSIQNNSSRQFQNQQLEKSVPKFLPPYLIRILFYRQQIINQLINVNKLLNKENMIRNLQISNQRFLGRQVYIGYDTYQNLSHFNQSPKIAFQQSNSQVENSQMRQFKQNLSQNQPNLKSNYSEISQPIQSFKQCQQKKQDQSEINQNSNTNQRTIKQKNEQQIIVNQSNSVNRESSPEDEIDNQNSSQKNISPEKQSKSDDKPSKLKRKQNKKITKKLSKKQQKANLSNNLQSSTDQMNTSFTSTNEQVQLQYPSTPMPQLTQSQNQENQSHVNYQRLCFSEDIYSNKNYQNYFQNQFWNQEQALIKQSQQQPLNEFQQDQNNFVQQPNNTGQMQQNYDQNYGIWSFYYKEHDKKENNQYQSHAKTLFLQNDDVEVDHNQIYYNDPQFINHQQNIPHIMNDNDQDEDEKIFSIIGEIKDNEEEQ